MTTERPLRGRAAATRPVPVPLLWFGLLGGGIAASALVLIGWWAVEVGCPGTERPFLLVTAGTSVVVTVASLAAAVVSNRRLKAASGRHDTHGFEGGPPSAGGGAWVGRTSGRGGRRSTEGTPGGSGAPGDTTSGRGGAGRTLLTWLVALVRAMTGRAPRRRPRGRARRPGIRAWELVGGGDRRRFLAVTAIYFDLLALGVVLFSLPPVLLQQPCV